MKPICVRIFLRGLGALGGKMPALVGAILTAATITAAAQETLPVAQPQEQPAAAEGESPAAPSAADVTGSDSRWQYFIEIDLPKDDSAGEYYDFVVPPAVFDAARYGGAVYDPTRYTAEEAGLYLGDLRLIDSAGKEVPYALRVRQPVGSKQPLASSVFNRATSPDGASQLTLDLGREPQQHNEMAVYLPGVDYRRRAILEGSANNDQWQRLLETQLVFFQSGSEKYDRRSISYPPSRFRYLRLSVYPDPEVDKSPVTIDRVEVLHTVTVPGENVTAPVTLHPREPTRGPNGPASAWIMDLSDVHVPCESLSVDIADAEFARDYQLNSGGAEGSDEPFGWITNGQWTRSAGMPRRPMVASFPERAAGRLKLVVTDYRNPPLDVLGATFSAPARQVVFAKKDDIEGPLRLYFGNPKAEPPHYDLERNLPAVIEPAPHRLALGERQDNPNFVPEPKPLTERLPWLIYAVLGTSSVVLAAVLVNLGRAVVKQHDEVVVSG